MIENINKEELKELYNQPIMADVIEFIQRRFPTAKDDPQWVSGNCYYFAVMLKSRFPKGFIVYNVIDGHFLFLYHSMLVDAVHHEYLDHKFVPSETNYMVNSSIVVWDYFSLYDSLQYERILRDCIK